MENIVGDASNTRRENEWWEGIPSKLLELLELWDKDVIFGVFAGDGLSKELAREEGGLSIGEAPFKDMISGWS